ncbi:MAG: PhzF family phenazine biosynthesis protein, partial [Candidatus Eremiobacteraeota bacterium]|nr:PhzF family phenazine biosynthesis protein [Candidatus Eremiobacteraeota bacterium]
RELAFAGHPTIGAAAVFCDRSDVTSPFLIDEEVGPVKIDVETDNLQNRVLWLTTPPVTFSESVDPDFCARLLGLKESDLRADVLPVFASAGSPLLFICLDSVEAVDRAQLQERYLAEALGSVNSVGTFIFARKEANSRVNFDVYSRMFAPQTGIPEDPATGGATGPLAAYMMRSDLVPANEPASFISEQGTKMGRQSLLHVRTNPAERAIKVGGSTVAIARGALEF